MPVFGLFLNWVAPPFSMGCKTLNNFTLQRWGGFNVRKWNLINRTIKLISIVRFLAAGEAWKSDILNYSRRKSLIVQSAFSAEGILISGHPQYFTLLVGLVPEPVVRYALVMECPIRCCHVGFCSFVCVRERACMCVSVACAWRVGAWRVGAPPRAGTCHTCVSVSCVCVWHLNLRRRERNTPFHTKNWVNWHIHAERVRAIPTVRERTSRHLVPLGPASSSAGVGWLLSEVACHWVQPFPAIPVLYW